jgi:hypothetical protein
MTKQIDQYAVTADRNTGEWLDEPEYVGVVNLSEWNAKVDTDDVHYDCYEHPIDSTTTVTRAIEVTWTE